MTAWLALWAVAASVLHLRERRRVARAARAGHEVRGPLCAARLALDGLERSARVQAIDLELRRAALALDDLAGRGRVLLETVDVGGLLVDAAPSWEALAASHGRELAIEPPGDAAIVRADPLRLAQACANLVGNAAEHGGGRVVVRAVTVNGRVRVEVADDGPGLPAPVSALVRAARGRRTARGHGLAIAAAIAERHGGRLTSAPTISGARLVLDLPAATPRSPRLAAVRSPVPVIRRSPAPGTRPTP
jgi:signal transduction histidine kinase